MSVINEYNETARQINRSLQVAKRGGAAYGELIGKLTTVIEKLEQAFYFYSQQKSELLKEKEKKDEFLLSLKKFQGDQSTKLKAANDSIETYNNMARNILTNMKFKTLAGVRRHESVEALFKFLFVNLYSEKEADFDFKKFTSVALKKDIQDFQVRLAVFTVDKLDAANREKLAQIKSMDFSFNRENEDLYFLLEWLEFNYEAFLALKEKEQILKTIKETSDKEKKYAVQSDASSKIVADIDSLVHYTENQLGSLKLIKRKLEEANNVFLKNPKHHELDAKMRQVFEQIDRFPGNEVVASIDSELNR